MSAEAVPDLTAEVVSNGSAGVVVGSGLCAIGDASHDFCVGDYVTLVLRDGTRESGVITSIDGNIISISRKDA